MTQFLNYFFAWIATFLTILLIIIYLLRKYIQKHKLPKNHPLSTLNYYLRKWHKLLAVLLVGFTFLHCRFSSQKLGLNWGTCALIIVVLLFFNFIYGKKRKKPWIKGHRILTVVFCAVLLIHIFVSISIRRIGGI